MSTKINYFEFLRGIAIYAVIFIHVNTAAYKFELTNIELALNISFRQLSNFAVPLFLFLSGFFMAKKVISDKKEYLTYVKKQVPRVLVPLVVWSFFYSFYNIYNGQGLKEVLTQFVTFQACVPFYFIILIIQYYVLQPLIVKLGRSTFLAMLSIGISLIMVLVTFEVKKVIDIPFIIQAGNPIIWLMFPVIGAWSRFNNITLSLKYLGCLSLLALGLSIYESYEMMPHYGSYILSVTAIKSSSFIYSIFVILFLIKFSKERLLNLSDNAFLVRIGKVSFGIYFMHMIVLSLSSAVFLKMGLNFFNNVFFQLTFCFFILLVCYVVCKITSRFVPNLSMKYLGY